MSTVADFVQIVAGFVPMIILVLSTAIVLYASTRMFPRFAARFNSAMDRLMGVDADYDERNQTGYASTTNRIDQYI